MLEITSERKTPLISLHSLRYHCSIVCEPLAFGVHPGFALCVCVSTPGKRVLNHLRQGRVALSPYHTQRSCGREWQAGPDQPCVPAFNTPTPMVHPAAVRRFHGPSCYCPSNTGSSATCSRREFSQRATAVTRQTFLLKHLHICGLFTLPFLHHF